MRRRSFLKKRGPQSEEMALQITSMADVFVILLVFILKSYSTASVEFTPAAGMKLPQAASARQARSRPLTVEVSRDAVLIEGKAVSRMQDYRFSTGDLEPGNVSRSLRLALTDPGNVGQGARLLVVADQRAPYATIKAVLASAAVRGYKDFELAVNHGE
jgi:biopolymer transport protein ExbD